jgi:hypothetical protein
MATRFDSFTRAECNILAASLAVYRDSALSQTSGLVNGAAPSRDNLLSELQGATNWAGKHIDLLPGGKLHPSRE